MKKINKLIVVALSFALIMAAGLVLDFIIYQKPNTLALTIFIVALIMIVALFIMFGNYHKAVADDVINSLNSSMTDALRVGEIGILVYNEDYEITWLSSMFNEKHLNRVGEKVLVWLPELQDLLSGKVKNVTVVINDEKYQVSKKEEAYALFFNDISREYDLSETLKNKAYVLGLVNFDNFDEASLSEDEIAYINTNIKVPVLEYFKSFGVVYKTLRNNRLQLILNNQIYQKLLDDRFSILKKVRRESKAGDVDVTLSISLTYGSDDLSELDEAASALLEIAETRGGDQVAVRELGKEAVFYGGSSEAKERQSRVKVRVVANTIRRMMQEASNVIIVGHKDADADCIGAAIATSLLAKSLKKDAYICLSGGVESMINEVLLKYDSTLKKKHNFVNEFQAVNYMNKDSLIVMVDHHSKATSNAPSILEEDNDLIIIDHHRRKADLDVDASFLYIEAGASSATEMVVEMFPYFNRGINVETEEANIMYIGLLIDTNHFRNRSDSRTFDVAKNLKQYGASNQECELMIEEPYDMSVKRYEIIAAGKRVFDNFMIADMRNDVITRSIASQAADMMVAIKEIQASFVIFSLGKNEYAISARSDGSINVQVIMEKLGGGGHMTAAGLQVKDKDPDLLYGELIDSLKEYLESVEEDESNTVE
ncbi:MAG: DHH family phosphoesterase [Erysipelotrichaceae bacterium]|nr:DHH family phosphoesterase [Erysipelotrichaceae bacterium]